MKQANARSGDTNPKELETGRQRLEVHFINDRWVIVHASNAGAANALVHQGRELAPPVTEPIGTGFRRHHDPSIFPHGHGTFCHLTLEEGEVRGRAKDSRHAKPGPEEVQKS
jgi:hypothetical protein